VGGVEEEAVVAVCFALAFGVRPFFDFLLSFRVFFGCFVGSCSLVAFEDLIAVDATEGNPAMGGVMGLGDSGGESFCCLAIFLFGSAAAAASFCVR